MNINELSILEIKGLLYDSLQERERILHNIEMLEREMSAREKGQEEKGSHEDRPIMSIVNG
jgi:hypothetical protein